LPVEWTSPGSDDLFEVAELLSRYLSRTERGRVHKIMTNPDLLQDDRLAQRILSAFARIIDHETENTVSIETFSSGNKIELNANAA
jgi:hypothetical protein